MIDTKLKKSYQKKGPVTSFCRQYGTPLPANATACPNCGAPAKGAPDAVEIWTLARDCGTFLAKAYRGELVSANASKRMVDLLLGQTRRTKIPAGVPAGVQVANKTGELAAVQNDVAIVYGTRPYVIAVMTNDVDKSAATNIADLSAKVYQTFEQ